jgi:hypothetical protein
MEAVNHVCSDQLLVVGVEEHCFVAFKRRACPRAPLDSTVLAEWHPATFEPLGQPNLVLDVLSIVGEVFDRSMHGPSQVR